MKALMGQSVAGVFVCLCADFNDLYLWDFIGHV